MEETIAIGQAITNEKTEVWKSNGLSEADAIKMLHEYNEDLLPKKFGIVGKAWTALLLIVFLTGVYCYTNQWRYGLSITGMRDFVFWGIYISNFVFFVAISLVGSLI